MRNLIDRILAWFGLLPLPIQGWEGLVRAFSSSGGLWQDPVTGVVGSPVEWSLCEWQDGRLVYVTERCVQSGRIISGETVIVRDAGGNPVSVDGTNWGVRCARCRQPLHWRQAGMRGQLNVPSCRKCRSRVQRVEREVRG